MFLFLGEEGEETEVESPKIYEPIGSFKELSDRLEMHQQQYNESIRGAKMDLVFFKVTVYVAGHLFAYERLLLGPLHVILVVVVVIIVAAYKCIINADTRSPLFFLFLSCFLFNPFVEFCHRVQFGDSRALIAEDHHERKLIKCKLGHCLQWNTRA